LLLIVNNVCYNTRSLKTDVVLQRRYAGVQTDGVLLEYHLLLDQRVGLLLEEVHLIDVALLQLEEVFLKVADVFNDLLQDVIRGLSCMVLKRSALRSQQLDFLLVVIKHLGRLLCISVKLVYAVFNGNLARFVGTAGREVSLHLL
jgi:hypothetical protein